MVLNACKRADETPEMHGEQVFTSVIELKKSILLNERVADKYLLRHAEIIMPYLDF